MSLSPLWSSSSSSKKTAWLATTKSEHTPPPRVRLIRLDWNDVIGSLGLASFCVRQYLVWQNFESSRLQVWSSPFPSYTLVYPRIPTWEMYYMYVHGTKTDVEIVRRSEPEPYRFANQNSHLVP